MNDTIKFQKNDPVWVECFTENGCLRKRPATVIAHLNKQHRYYENEQLVIVRYKDDEATKNAESRFECVLEKQVSHRKEKE